MSIAQGPGAWRLGHRPELDGLRGVAIAMVLTMHATGYMRGTLGVLIFFVLSGFLITTLLLEERADHGRVALAAFYWRRAVRLLPALAVVLIGVGAWMVIAGHADDVPGQFMPAALYYMNWAAMDGPVGSVGHTWSLAIEEQFYLLWPLVMLGLLAVGGKRLALGTVVGGVVVSIALRFVLADAADTGRAYYGSDTNAFALLLGCALAIAITTGWHPTVPRWVSVGSTLVLGLTFTVNQSEYTALTVGDSVGAIAATFGIAALVTMPRRHPILAAGLLVALGRISYGLYLVHIPVRTVVDDTVGADPLWLRALLIILISVGVAIVMWTLVERPVQRLLRGAVRGGRVSSSGARRTASASRAPATPAETPGTL